MTRTPIEIQRSDVRRSWRSKEPKVVQRNENKPEVEMRARKAAARNNAARPSLPVPRRKNRNSFSRHWEHGKLANDSTIRPYSPILAPASGGHCLSERVEHD